MNRPPYPRLLNNFRQSQMPHNHQWPPNQDVSPRFLWNNPRFGAPVMRTENCEEHWCETCDRGFPTAEFLHKHKLQHQKCNIDGCQFIAHPKVITKHIQMQHSTGLYKKIANINKPEDIQKWRDERKKKYPTKSNIEKKIAECKEKIERGEKMALKHDHRNDKHGSTAQGSSFKRKHGFDKMNQTPRMIRQNFKSNSSVSTKSQPAKKIPRVIPCAPTAAEKNKLKPFTGIVNIEMDLNTEDTAEPLEFSNRLFEDEDEETLVIPKETVKTQEPALCGALTSLMCDYGTSDEETGEKENEVLNILSVTSKQLPVEPPRTDSNKIVTAVMDKFKLLENNESDDDGPEEVKIVKTNVEHETAQETLTKPKEKPVKHIMPPRKLEKHNKIFKRKIPSTLLQKLLHKEIRNERNIVLQCIRYIKKMNYFDKSSQ